MFFCRKVETLLGVIMRFFWLEHTTLFPNDVYWPACDYCSGRDHANRHTCCQKGMHGCCRLPTVIWQWVWYSEINLKQAIHCWKLLIYRQPKRKSTKMSDWGLFVYWEVTKVSDNPSFLFFASLLHCGHCFTRQVEPLGFLLRAMALLDDWAMWACSYKWLLISLSW